METIDVARRLDLPDWAVGAGFVRNLVWDHLHARPEPTPLNDIDLLYFDPADLSRDSEARFEQALTDLLPDRPWSVRNQARMHVGNADDPYRSTVHAMSHWLETATAVGVRQAADGALRLLAPFGTADLFGLRLVATGAGIRKRQAFVARIRSKGWLQTWPGLTLAVTDDAGANPRR